MRTLHDPRNRREREQQDAVRLFREGMPDHFRGRLLTSSSEIDPHRSKPPRIVQRLEAERDLRAFRFNAKHHGARP